MLNNFYCRILSHTHSFPIIIKQLSYRNNRLLSIDSNRYNLAVDAIIRYQNHKKVYFLYMCYLKVYQSTAKRRQWAHFFTSIRLFKDAFTFMFILCIINLRENEHFLIIFVSPLNLLMNRVQKNNENLTQCPIFANRSCELDYTQQYSASLPGASIPLVYARSTSVRFDEHELTAQLPQRCRCLKKRRQSQKIETSACKQKNFIRKYKNRKDEEISQSQRRRKRESKKL